MFSNHLVPYAIGKDSCPVASVVISTLENEAFECSKEALDFCERALCKQINREISFEESSAILKQYAHTNLPAIMVSKILDAFDNHKPEKATGAINDFHKKCRMWNSEEDILLLAAIHKYGLGDWKSISVFVGGGRSRSQCSQRWGRALDPRITKVPWSAQEESKLLELVTEHGEHSWATVAKSLGTRSDVQCRYRYYQVIKRKNSLVKPEPQVAKTVSNIVPQQIYNNPIPKAPTHIEVLKRFDFHEISPVNPFFNKNLFNCPLEELIPPLKPRIKKLSEPASPITLLPTFITVF